MTLKISDNIKNLRKQKGVTQEQLAEALGVTAGAVYKWEAALSVPDILLIMEIADFFEVSLDSLLGFEMRSGKVAVVKNRIVELRREKNFEEAVSECEKALRKYPNNFDIVYQSAMVFELKGIEERDKKSTIRCIELYEKALLLLPQNTDSDISEYTLQSSIAEGYLTAGQHEKGIELLKKCNVDGVYDSLIGMTYSFSPEREEAEKGMPYLAKSFGHVVMSSFRTMLGFANVYARRNDVANALDVMQWLVNFLDSVRKNEDSSSYTEKSKAVLLAQCAIYLDILGRKSEADEALERAYITAKRFDEKPNYGICGLKFCEGIEKTTVAYDDMGKSALSAVENSITENPEYPESEARILELWNKMLGEI
ncbi:MAG: helix-turn-helix transcriptional regulator [Clostridia bacterium]|nr:helix-turn-helix transcriptional regulator [Clostridia bacterium]